MMVICIKQHLSNIWRSVHEKAKQHWGWVEKSFVYKKKRVKLNCRRFSYFQSFAHDIIAENTIHSNIYICIGAILLVEKVDKERKQQKDIERRVCSQKSDIPHPNSSMYFFLKLNVSFLVSHEALIVLQRTTKRAHLRKSPSLYLK